MVFLKSLWASRGSFRVFSFSMHFWSKKPTKNLSKTMSEPSQHRCWKYVVFWYRFFQDLGANLAGFWPPCWNPHDGDHPGFFPSCVQEAATRLQERPTGFPGASNSLPRGPQECPRATKTCPGHAQGASRGWLFWGFLGFFNVFLRFSAFSFVFLRFSVFFYSVPLLTFPPCRAS